MKLDKNTPSCESQSLARENSRFSNQQKENKNDYPHIWSPNFYQCLHLDLWCSEKLTTIARAMSLNVDIKSSR